MSTDIVDAQNKSEFRSSTMKTPIQAPAVDRSRTKVGVAEPRDQGVKASFCDGTICYCGAKMACCPSSSCHLDANNTCACG
jgi:hypothetical protein